MRPRFALHLAGILTLAAGVCWGVLAQSSPDPPTLTGADVKRLAAARAESTVSEWVSGATAPVGPRTRVFDALPDGVAFRRVRRSPRFGPGTVTAGFPEWPEVYVYVDPAGAWYNDDERGWLWAPLDPADAVRVRAALLAALAAAASPPGR